MRILFDQGTPLPLRRELAPHDVSSAGEMGWGELTNGELIRKAEQSFDLILTTDQNMRFEQNLAGKSIAVLVLTSTSWPRIRLHKSKINEAILSIKPGTFAIVQIPD